MVWDTVSDRWEAAYSLAKTYWEEHGNLCVPARYKTESGFSLDEWVRSQREEKASGSLSQEQIERPDMIGMDWLSPSARLWETRFEACKSYFEEHGDLNIPTTYTTCDGFHLGLWLWRIQCGKTKLKNSGENGNRVERLESISIKWRNDKE